jgi:RNA polymerase sigma-70 factor (ECF subfamily)
MGSVMLFRGRPELLAAFRRGDRAALEEVYWATLDTIERLVWAGVRRAERARWIRGGRSSDVEDLVQDTYVRAFDERARSRYDGLRDFEPYLATIARNVLIDWVRARGELPAGAADDLTAEPPQDEEPWASEAVMRTVETYLARVPPELKAVHEERYVRGTPQREAAERLGISRQQLRTREQKLRDGLLRVLREHGLADM